MLPSLSQLKSHMSEISGVLIVAHFIMLQYKVNEELVTWKHMGNAGMLDSLF